MPNGDLRVERGAGRYIKRPPFGATSMPPKQRAERSHAPRAEQR